MKNLLTVMPRVGDKVPVVLQPVQEHVALLQLELGLEHDEMLQLVPCLGLELLHPAPGPAVPAVLLVY